MNLEELTKNAVKAHWDAAGQPGGDFESYLAFVAEDGSLAQIQADVAADLAEAARAASPQGRMDQARAEVHRLQAEGKLREAKALAFKTQDAIRDPQSPIPPADPRVAEVRKLEAEGKWREALVIKHQIQDARSALVGAAARLVL